MGDYTKEGSPYAAGIGGGTEESPRSGKIILAKNPTLHQMREVSDCVDDAGMGGGETDGRAMTAGSDKRAVSA